MEKDIVDMYYPPKNKVTLPNKLFTPVMKQLRKSAISKRVLGKQLNKRINGLQTKKVIKHATISLKS